MRRVAIIGVGCSKYGVRQDVNVAEIGFEAVKPAFEFSFYFAPPHVACLLESGSTERLVQAGYIAMATDTFGFEERWVDEADGLFGKEYQRLMHAAAARTGV
ncbi:MAG: hypothetical protein ACFFBS_09735, partial [Promethearchaeota archaeon]